MFCTCHPSCRHCESPRILRELKPLRKWSGEQIKSFVPRSARTRCVFMLEEHRREYQPTWATIGSIALEIGCASQTLYEWSNKHDIYTGMRKSDHQHRACTLYPSLSVISGPASWYCHCNWFGSTFAGFPTWYLGLLWQRQT